MLHTIDVCNIVMLSIRELNIDNTTILVTVLCAAGYGHVYNTRLNSVRTILAFNLVDSRREFYMRVNCREREREQSGGARRRWLNKSQTYRRAQTNLFYYALYDISFAGDSLMKVIKTKRREKKPIALSHLSSFLCFLSRCFPA